MDLVAYCQSLSSAERRPLAPIALLVIRP
jgi:hypothetical protein